MLAGLQLDLSRQELIGVTIPISLHCAGGDTPTRALAGEALKPSIRIASVIF